MGVLRCLFVGVLLLGSLPVTADILYSVTDLGSIAGSKFDTRFPTRGTDINNAGEVTGGMFEFRSTHAFLYSDGVMRDLGTPRPDHPDDLTVGFGINNLGQVTGTYSRGEETYHHGFLYSNGQMTDIGTLPGGDSSFGNRINDAGQVVGEALTSELVTHAVLYTDGLIIDLGALPNSSYATANAINNAGQVVGYSNTLNGSSVPFSTATVK